MRLGALIRTAGGNDVKLFSRDRFLVFMFLFGVIIAVALRYILPWLNGYLAETGLMPGAYTDMYFSDSYPLVVAYLIIYTGATLVGAIYGFMLLDERDDNTIMSMLVTPVALSRYISYRVGSMVLLAFVMIMVMLFCAGIIQLPVWQLLLIAGAGSLAAPIAALFYATVAENKVQGFAYAKFGGIAAWTILIGWFIADPWQWLFGIFPPFLVSKAYWMALAGDPLWLLALGLSVLFQCMLIAFQMRWFNAVVRR